MPSNLFYLPEPYEKGALISLTGEEYAHLGKVMRASVGDQVSLANGSGQQAVAEVLTMEKQSAELKLLSVEKLPLTAGAILYLALTRQSSLEWVVEKATELGASEIRLFPGDKSDRGELSENQRRRLQALLISALKQSGRAYLPKLLELPPIAEWSGFDTPTLFGTFEPGAPLLLERLLDPSAPIPAFLVGPESGISSREEKKLKKLGAFGVSLGGNILRAETAAVTATALLSQALYYRASGAA